MVVMSIDDYQDRKFTHDVDMSLLEACDEAINTEERLTHEEVVRHMSEIIKNASPKI